MPFAAAWMDLEIVELNEVGQIEREVFVQYSYMQNLKKKKIQMNLFAKSRNKTCIDIVMQKHTGKIEDTNERSLIQYVRNQSPAPIFTPYSILSALVC